ncbi:sugar phosphate isomerase/epimerase family protein [Lignipirellula cremea]|uniref:Xylose isomerase-like TIM barrel n=1 Tax=Lignipirellula cremea TaxID=2528010 RepID=A0A518E1U3_9BACT|nr:sugar phosphate isomerase/epimerase family protein [Lignipirellula cremea]QDU98060.1 Xylose isomerase-like TIM barrel [Lignipirellula cremea]
MEKWPIGVFASIDAGLGVKLEVAQELGVPTIQLHAPAKASRSDAKAAEFLKKIADMGLTLTCVFGGFEGETYGEMSLVEKTVGLVPPEFRYARTQEMMEIADFAKKLQCDAVALHLGYIPEDGDNGLYDEVIAVTREVCDHCKTNGQTLHLETGQETADGLLKFIHDSGCDNLFVNFDPANMIIYGTGEPIEALGKVGQYVRSVHCKDGVWSDAPGKTFGREVPLGEGDVGMENYLRKLEEIGYTGPLTIEREIPQEPARQKAEIGHAVNLLNDLKAKIG